MSTFLLRTATPPSGKRRQFTCATAGFTLIEVMTALSILGLGVFILLDAHLGALNLHETMVEEVTMRQLIETAVTRAEADVITGIFSGSGDFGMQFPEYTWSYEAVPGGADPDVLLYEVSVSIIGPEEQRDLSFFTYNVGREDEDSPDGGMLDENSSNIDRDNNNGGGSRSGMNRSGNRNQRSMFDR